MSTEWQKKYFIRFRYLICILSISCFIQLNLYWGDMSPANFYDYLMKEENRMLLNSIGMNEKYMKTTEKMQ